MRKPIQPIGDNFIPVIPVDYKEHTPDHPFCSDLSCPCHQNREEVNALLKALMDGLITGQEATFIYGSNHTQA
jgi:hypothetical protein